MTTGSNPARMCPDELGEDAGNMVKWECKSGRTAYKDGLTDWTKKKCGEGMTNEIISLRIAAHDSTNRKPRND